MLNSDNASSLLSGFLKFIIYSTIIYNSLSSLLITKLLLLMLYALAVELIEKLLLLV